MTAVSQLGYIGFEVSDLAAWETFATKVLGVAIADRSDSGFTLRWDRNYHRVFITEGPLDDVALVGFECASEDDLETTAQALRDAGHDLVAGTADECAHRRVKKLYKFTEHAGNPAEIYVGPERVDAPFRSELVRTGFVADELGLGHLVLRARDRDATADWYQNVLGFKLSDHIVCDIGGFQVDIAFLHVNPRHHSIALGAMMPKRMHHIMWQVGSIDDVGAAFDRCTDNRVPIMQTLGRHPNDKMISFYAMTPSGFEFEYGCGAREVDDATWEPTTYDHISEWGHRRLPYPKPNR